MKQIAYVGEDSIKELVPILKQYSPSSIFVVRGKDSYNVCGARDIVDQIKTELNCTCSSFFDFSENPKYEDVLVGIDLLSRSNANIIIAIGGGSVLDMAKLIRFFSSYEGSIENGVYLKKANVIPLIALPTTAGTGAETTHFAVVYKNKVKYSVEHEYVLPDYAIVYPQLTYKNSAYLTACAGFDALAQAIEAYWNKNATEESDMFAKKAINMLWSNLPIAVNAPNNNVRNLVSEGAYWAGRAINITKTTAPHAFSYPFTSYYGYPHGHALALVFPYIAAYNLSEYARKDDIFAMIDCPNDDVENYFKEYIRIIGLDMRREDDIDLELIISNINIDRLKNNPIDITKQNSLEIFNRLLCANNLV